MQVVIRQYVMNGKKSAWWWTGGVLIIIKIEIVNRNLHVIYKFNFTSLRMTRRPIGCLSNQVVLVES